MKDKPKFLVYLSMDRLNGDNPYQPEGEFTIRCDEPVFRHQFGFKLDIRKQLVTVFKDGKIYAEMEKGVPKGTNHGGQKAALGNCIEIYSASQGSLEGHEGEILTKWCTPVSDELFLDIQLACTT